MKKRVKRSERIGSKKQSERIGRMKKSTVFFLSTTLLLLGIIIGFLGAPAKHGFFMGNHGGKRGFPVPRCFSHADRDSVDGSEEDAD
jgi:hypothetical protein